MPSPLPSIGEARVAELVRAYLAAEYRWEYDGDWLRLSIGEPVPDLDRRFPETGRYGLLSAWNPYSIARPDAINRAADETLRRDLQESGTHYRPAFSSAANRTWREPSWLVFDMAPDAFDALSRRHGQLATLYWHARDTVRMRVDAAPPAGLEAHPQIDWLRS